MYPALDDLFKSFLNERYSDAQLESLSANEYWDLYEYFITETMEAA